MYRLFFAEYAFFFNEYLISNFVSVVNVSIILVLIATISQWLPVLFNFMPVNNKQNVKEHV